MRFGTWMLDTLEVKSSFPSSQRAGGTQRTSSPATQAALTPAKALIELTLPCSTITLSELDGLLSINFDSLPGDIVTFRIVYEPRPDVPDAWDVECRAFGDVANCVARDENFSTVGQPGPDGTASFDAPPNMVFNLGALRVFLEERIGGPVESLTPVEVTYSDADGKVGGGTFGEAAQSEGADWLTELIADSR